MDIHYDKAADAIYIQFNNKTYSHGEDLDEERRIDYDADGNLIGVELLCVSEGVITDDLPNKAEIEKALDDRGIKIYA
ncbi:DUF2283 domain-containing protein [Chloroflexota bacterium]